MVDTCERLSHERRNLGTYVYLALVGKVAANLSYCNLNICLLLEELVLLLKEEAYTSLESVKEVAKLACGRLLAPTKDKLGKRTLCFLISFSRLNHADSRILGSNGHGVSLMSCLGNNLNLALKILVGRCAELLLKSGKLLVTLNQQPEEITETAESTDTEDCHNNLTELHAGVIRNRNLEDARAEGYEACENRKCCVADAVFPKDCRLPCNLTFTAKLTCALDCILNLVGDADSGLLRSVIILRIAKCVVGLVHTLSRNEKVGEILVVGIEACTGIFLYVLVVELCLLIALLLQKVKLVEGLNEHGVVVRGIKLIELGLLFLGLDSSLTDAMKLGLLIKDSLVITVRCLKLLAKCSFSLCKVNDCAPCTALVEKRLHLIADAESRTLFIYFLTAREDDILNGFLYLTLVNGRVANCSDKGGVVEELAVHTEEHLACRKLAKYGCACLCINDGCLLTVCLLVAVVSRNGAAADDVSLAAYSDVHRALCSARLPADSLLSLAKLLTLAIGEAVEHISDECGDSALARLVLTLDNVDSVGELESHVVKTAEALD